jgi:hypothetical protein
VRAVAKRLAFGKTACTPEISAWFSFLNDGGFLGDCWFHNVATITALEKNATTPSRQIAGLSIPLSKTTP